MKKTLIGKNDNGTDRFDYSDEPDDHNARLVTGPISGTVVLKDGSVYNLTDEILHHHVDHTGALHHHIEKLHERSGTFGDFKHVCSDACGDEADESPTTTA